jgi:hypothetical protein
VGALGIYEMCLGWRRIEDEELARDGRAHVEALAAEVEAVRRSLNARFQEPLRMTGT